MSIASILTPQWWTPKDEDGQDRPISFQLQPLSGLEYADAMTMISQNEDGKWVIDTRGMRFLLRVGLLDWRQPSDAEQLPEFSHENAWQFLDFMLLGELAGQIMSLAALTDEQKKTFTSPSRS